ncbi:MAG: tetratricopeptide repeat protein [Potamolinea sp.]
MLETQSQLDFLAAAVVGISLAILAFLLSKTVITSSIFKKGVNLYNQKDYKNAEAAFRKVIKLQRTNDMVRLLLGNTLLEQDKLEDAASVFQELISRSPKNIDAYLSLGEVLIKQASLWKRLRLYLGN